MMSRIHNAKLRRDNIVFKSFTVEPNPNEAGSNIILTKSLRSWFNEAILA